MLPTSVRWRVRSTHNSTTCPSSSTAIRDSCAVALMTISRDMGGDCRLRDGAEIHSGRVGLCTPHSGIAQLVEQRTVNPRVVGSSPTAGASVSFEIRASPRSRSYFGGDGGGGGDM